MKEKDIIEILEDDKNYKDLEIPFEDGGGSTTYRELDFSKVALAILSKLKEKEIVLAKGKMEKYKGNMFIADTDLQSLSLEIEGDLYQICKKNLNKTITIRAVVEDDV